MTPKLGDLLSKWPMPEQTQLEADEAAERFAAAAQAGQLPGVVDDSLLQPPLPKSGEEGESLRGPGKPGAVMPGMAVETKMSKDRTRDRTSFQELAKLAQTTPPPPTASQSGPHAPSAPPSASASGPSGVLRGEEASSSDSGIVDLKAIVSADPSGAQRAQTTPLAAEGLFEDDAAPAKAAPTAERASAPVASAKAEVSGPPSASAVAQTATPSTPPKKKAAADAEKKGGGGVLIVLGSLVAAGAIAAGVFFYVKSQHARGAVAATTTESVPDKGKAASKPTVAGATTTTAAASIAQADIDTTQDNPQGGQGGVGKPSFHFHSKAGGGAGGAASAAPDTAASGGIDPKLVANVPTGPAGGGSGDLAEAMKAAAGGGTGLGQGGGGGQANTFAPGSVPQRPSQGQVSGAIGNTLPAARACLGSDEPVSRATVTLQSDGTVKSVSVSGFAAGKPQEACIKAALSKMSVSPFAEATYPVPVVIRPN